MESDTVKTITEDVITNEERKYSKSREANWPTVLFFIHIHLLASYGVWIMFNEATFLTHVLLLSLVMFGVLGVTTGAHRLWAHQTYTATTSLKIFLMLCQTLAGQGSIYEWVRYHRFHHKHFGTDVDPYNHNKGFFFAHFSTRLKNLSEYQENLLNEIDMTDLDADTVVMFQKRFYWLLYLIIFLLLPINAPLEYWDDSVLSAIFVIGFLRYLIVLHMAWLVESAICVWGLQPGDKFPPDTNFVFIINKSYWTKYHYLMPQDYKSGEYGTYDSGCSTAFIRVWAALGLATDLKTMETVTVQRALIDAVHSKRSISTCLTEAMSKQSLPADHFLQRSAFSG